MFNKKVVAAISPLEPYSSLNNSRWTFDYEHGLTLNRPTIFDTAFYYFVGHTLPIVNGKRVNIKHDEETREMLKAHFSLDQVNAADVIAFSLIATGN